MEKIRHDKKNQKFITAIDGAEAYLKYRDLENGVLDVISTSVPPQGRGQGVAGELTEEIIKFAKKNSLKIFPSCSYVDRYLSDRPELKDIVAK